MMSIKSKVDVSLKEVEKYENEFLRISNLTEKDISEIWRNNNDPYIEKHMLAKFKETSDPICYVQRLDPINKKLFFNYFGIQFNNEVNRVHNFFLIIQSTGIKLFFSLSTKDREKMISWQ